MKSIAEIKKEYEQTPFEEVPAFIDLYASDERAGVVSILKKAKKQIDDYEKELARTQKMYAFENEYATYSYICGIDEVGRGPLAGPVVAGAVILPKDYQILYLNDSKQLSAKKREELYDKIMSEAVSVGIGMADHQRIDEINILQATKEAMLTAVRRLPILPEMLLIDAVKLEETDIPQASVIKGDARCMSIAAASILAKVERDRLMAQMDSLYPEYGFLKHKGYGTKEHIEAIRKFGPCPVHRATFIKSFL